MALQLLTTLLGFACQPCLTRAIAGAPACRERGRCDDFIHTGYHRDAISGTDRQAFDATGAVVCDNGMQLLCSAEDGVGRTNLEAERAADAIRLIDQRDAK